MFRAQLVGLPCQIWMFGFILCAGCGVGTLFSPRPPRIIPVEVNYFPYFVKGQRPSLPPAQVLVLRPVDEREPYPMRKGALLPPSQDHIALLGIWGLSSEEGVVKVNSTQLGAQRRMEAGITNEPDRARGIYALPGLPNIVQDALVMHLREVGLPAQEVHFSSPKDPAASNEQAHYAVGCAIKEFSLVSLERHTEVLVDHPLNAHFIYIPIRGPTRADVSLALTLYRWPSGEVLWEGTVSDSVDDPPLGEHDFLYGSPGEVMSIALTRAVGSLLIAQELQQVLLTTQSS
jgi:hypothetical protein